MANKIYLAYGSNLNIAQMRVRYPGARILSTAAIENYELLFKGSRTGSYLTIESKEGASVPVAAWQVTEADERSLDRYEGYPNEKDGQHTQASGLPPLRPDVHRAAGNLKNGLLDANLPGLRDAGGVGEHWRERNGAGENYRDDSQAQDMSRNRRAAAGGLWNGLPAAFPCQGTVTPPSGG